MNNKVVAIAAVAAIYFYGSFASGAELPDCSSVTMGPFSDRCSHTDIVKRIMTFDVKVKAEHAKEGDISVEIPYDNIRSSGVVLQIYYSGVAGKSQWFVMPRTSGVALFPGSILLPIGKWMQNGLKPGHFVRVVLMVGEK